METGCEKLLVRKDVQIRTAIKQMGEAGEKVLFVVDDAGRLHGSVSDGDIRRWILKEGNLNDPIVDICNENPRYVRTDYGIDDVKSCMLKDRVEALPVIDESGCIKDVLLWINVLSEKFTSKAAPLKVPVFVMAGGKGVRMDPFTRILPKPLVPLGDKPIVEVIMDSFADCGCTDFHLTVNYKGKMIQSYFDNSDCKYNLRYVWEDVPLGTAGGIKLACKGVDARHAFVSNCDVLVKVDYHDVYNFHIKNDNAITIVGSMKHFTIPYGVLNLKNGGSLQSIDEKPEYDYLVSTGLYLINRGIIEMIPDGKRFDFDELIEVVKESGGKVCVYPVNQHAWVDVGQWTEYHRSMERLGLIK